MFRYPIFYAALTFIISAIFVNVLLPELACMDGWKSPSIGKSGACSHHGGVDDTAGTIGLIFGFGLSFWVWKKAKRNEDKLVDPENHIIDSAEKISCNIISIANKICCKVWNIFIKIITLLGFFKILKKWPVFTVIITLFTLVTLSPIVPLIFIFGFIAFKNDASAETNYLIPNVNSELDNKIE